jgi:hypothetical protein
MAYIQRRKKLYLVEHQLEDLLYFFGEITLGQRLKRQNIGSLLIQGSF